MSDSAAQTSFDDAAPAASPAPPGGPQLAAPVGWPEPPDDRVYDGLVGELVHAIAPHTEADPIAILAQLLIAAGAAIGRGAHYRIEATRHHPNEFVVLVGDSAKARKGSSWDHVARVLEQAQPGFARLLRTGLSSGEGLVWAVRDPTGADPGPPERRLLVVEPEFASVLKQSSRDINTLSPVLRSAWDGRPLAVLTRTAPARATDAHIAVIGHITAAELQHHTNHIELANGFLNRFLLIACRRVRLLPEGGNLDPLHATGLPARLAANLTNARRAGQLRLTTQARALWHDAYQRLSEPTPGPAGALTARAEAHAIRLALIYALTDAARNIHPRHLHAALALQAYTARSAAWALAGATGDPLAEQIHNALQAAPDGLTRTQLRDLFHRNRPAERVDQALAALAACGRATRQRILTAGRPAELWTTATPAPRR
jgi:hypothetical protein